MLSRRDFLKASTVAGLTYSASGLSRNVDTPYYKIDIGVVTVDLSPRHRLKTTAYNGQVPGALLRFKENQLVNIEVTNHSDRAEVVHWHGLFTPPAVDGSVEEGTPAIPVGASARYAFTPRPAGFRWYHTHTMAMDDFTHGQYSGQHGFLMIEARDNPARYDQEVFLALHDWKGHLLASDDGAMNPSYLVSTINGKVMGFAEPLRVREGQRVLLHILNSSPTEVHWIALSGHSFEVVALDGNPVPTTRVTTMLRLAPAERVSAIVKMDNPGVWVLGEVRKHVQALGMGMAIEYENKSAAPRWDQPPQLIWNYEQFAAEHIADSASEPAIAVPLVIESRFRGHGAMERWTINGESYPDTKIAPLVKGQRYRLQFINKSLDDHPLHLHRHSFELRSLGTPVSSAPGAAPSDIRGIVKDVVLVDAQTCAEVEFTADNPGGSLLHCHQQNHMDLGFMMLLDYV